MELEQTKATNNGAATMQQPDVLDAEINDLLKAMGNPAPGDLNPAGRVAQWGYKVRALNIHSAHRQKVAGIVAQFRRDTVELLAAINYAGLKPVCDKFYNDIWYGGYTEAPREPSQDEVWRPRAKAAGWSDDEYERTVRWGTQGGAKVKDVNWELMEFSDGKIFKLQRLRLSLRPLGSDIPDEEWLAQFPPIRDPNAPAPTPPVIVAGAVASGPGMVYSDRQVFDSTRASHENPK
jgi:hypothetical protein